MFEIVFWSILSIAVYIWLGYPVLVLVLCRFKKNDSVAEEKHDFLPKVTVLVTVRNEERVIERRIKNLFQADYPKNLLEILIVSDGSTDKTDQLVEKIILVDSRIRLIKEEGKGKSHSQNKVIPQCKGEIIILTDAETTFDEGAIKNLAKIFANMEIGCATGKLLLRLQDSAISKSQGLYWQYELFLRKIESRLGILHTASGSVMAFRKNLFKPFSNTYGEDCMIPLDTLLSGYRVIHVEEARAYDFFPSSLKGTLQARIRMTLRNITGTLSKYPLLNPFRFPLVSTAILSHKILRWLTPYFMIVLLITNLVLVTEGVFYLLLFCIQVLFYFSGVIGFISEKKNYHMPIASQAFSFLLANTGFFLGVLYAIKGQRIAVYKR